ncbi:hypothetical protein BYT27DRAFT_7251576 [Phlegmacium glaucopus]|nr:hypothetical protein BYT27DRAFT_7251576 [Phlegmacium glaucopus]
MYYLWSDPTTVSTRLTKRSPETQPVTTIPSPEITPKDGFASHPIGEPTEFESTQSFLDKPIPTTVILVNPTISLGSVAPLAIVLPSPVTPDRPVVDFPVEKLISYSSTSIQVPAASFVYPTNILDLSFMKSPPDDYMYLAQDNVNASAEAGDSQHVTCRTNDLYLPLPGESTAPFFDKTKPRELSCFFKYLEWLYAKFGVSDERRKKECMVGYTYWETEGFWKAFEEFGDPTATYNDLKAAVIRMYPGSNDNNLYTIRNMDFLIGKRQHLGIMTRDELADFHTKYIILMQWLISKGYIGKHKQQHGYMRAIPHILIPAVTTRLQIAHPHHNPLLPYAVEEIFEATQFMLQSSSNFLPAYFAQQQPSQTVQQRITPEPVPVPRPSVPAEGGELGMLFAEIC